MASQNYTTPGTYTFAVPAYATLSVTVNGAGGGGSAGQNSGTIGGSWYAVTPVPG